MTTKAESGANQNVVSLSLSLSLRNPIHFAGKSKSEEKSHLLRQKQRRKRRRLFTTLSLKGEQQ